MSKPENSIDHVLDRMVLAMLGEDAHFKSHALALGIPHNTIRTWKRRGEVPLATLKNFALDWKVSLDWLLHGGPLEVAQGEPHQVNQNVQPYGLSADEAALLETYREIYPEARITLQNLLRIIAGAGRVAEQLPSSKPRQRPASMAHVQIRDGNLPDKKFTPPGGKKKKDGTA